MTNIHATTTPQSDIDLPDFPRPTTDEYVRDVDPSPLYSHLACTRYVIGTWDGYGVRVLTNETDEYATIHFRIPRGLPAAWASQLATFSTQRISYTARDRSWDEESGGWPTSNRDRWSAFVDSVLAAIDFARAALETAVWAHARGEDWSWPSFPPGRIETKYELWGDGHPNRYDPEEDYARYLEESGKGAGATPAGEVVF
ncbi:hypothetical protein [Microbacterium paraoxydans]|jgi:hypothetical protein|uniref:hypothetical protein n=1 Tax=Microbacterium paraoxydans TaxID=199592 RepID=UPI003D7407D4